MADGRPPALGACQPIRLDDSASPRSHVQSQQILSERGRPMDDSSTPAQFAIVRFGRVDYRLTTSDYVGKTARIYYVVPLAIPGLLSPAGLKVEWRARGLFANGAARPGERTLVWSGTVREPFMNESFELKMEIRLRTCGSVRAPACRSNRISRSR